MIKYFIQNKFTKHNINNKNYVRQGNLINIFSN